MLEATRIRAYAKKVARQASVSGRPAMEDRYEGGAVWFVGAVASEGFWARSAFNPGPPRWVESFEERGELYVLSANGDLLASDYGVFAGAVDNPAPANCWATPTQARNLSFRLLADAELTCLDRPNLGRYADVRPIKKIGEFVRMELRANFRVNVHARGLGLSMALKNIYVQSGGASRPRPR
ncbi:hypothetical protein [Cryobacterium sp. MDB2-10]|uniref:hypothetical protein n=1 Tax=Cryobacterium sp. MDB2-10 TaxID=1259177 RepID=UPI001072F2F3|nr:hypothetical protein [Cryobacterium sp. MDB2-10]TFC19892.1 hypothetical protein E3O51_06020 [Cryobacterium sp. MDB2-10]